MTWIYVAKKINASLKKLKKGVNKMCIYQMDRNLLFVEVIEDFLSETF